MHEKLWDKQSVLWEDTQIKLAFHIGKQQKKNDSLSWYHIVVVKYISSLLFVMNNIIIPRTRHNLPRSRPHTLHRHTLLFHSLPLRIDYCLPRPSPESPELQLPRQQPLLRYFSRSTQYCIWGRGQS